MPLSVIKGFRISSCFWQFL